MTLSELIAHFCDLGIVIDSDGRELRINAPKGAVTASLMREIHRHKQELVAVCGERVLGGRPVAVSSAWQPDTDDVVAWFVTNVDRLPRQSFWLNNYTEVVGPERFYTELLEMIRQGPRSYAARSGILRDRLLELRAIVDRSGMRCEEAA